MKNNTRTYFNAILKGYRIWETADKLRHLGLNMSLVNSIYLVLCLVIESIWYPAPEIKVFLWLGLLFNVYFVFRVISAVLDLLLKHAEIEDEDLLLKIGQQYPDVNDRLLNHYQLLSNNNEISRFAVQDFISKYPLNGFSNSYHKVPIKTKSIYAIFAFVILVIISTVSASALGRFAHPKRVYEPENEHRVSIAPSDISIYTYDSLSFTIKKNAPPHYPLVLEYLSDEGERITALRSRDSLVRYSAGRIKESRTYLAHLLRPNIFHPRKYIDTDTLTVKLLQRPRIRKMDIRVESPEYSKIPIAEYQGNIDRLTMLHGSQVNLDIELSEAFGESYLFCSKDTLQLIIRENKASISWVPEQNGKFTLNIINQRGITLETPPSYMIVIEKDLYPEIRVIEPKNSDDIVLNDNMTLPYVINLQDDYGISGFSVNYTSFSEYSFYNDTTVKSISLPFAGDSRMQTRVGIWEINDFISPGSEIRYYFELSDNDQVSGPKTVRTSLYYAKLPTLSDLYDSQNEVQEETMAMLEEELISTEEIVEELDEIQKQLLMEGEMNWENKSSLEENLQSLENVQKELEEMQSALNEQKKFMEENALFSDDVMKSFEQLQELMNELIDDEMFNMLQDLQEKLERNDMSNMEEILEDFTEKAKRFEESLDRMLEVFKRIQQEQRLEELGKKIKESLKEQRDLLERTEERSNEDLAEEQNKLASEVEKWESLSKESLDLFEDEHKELFSDYLKKMEEMNVSEGMKDASESFQEGDKQQGNEQSQRLEEKLNSLEKAFSQMSSQMMQEQKEEIAQAFQRAFHQTLYLSGQHEKILEEGKNLSNGSPLIHNYTSQMNDNLELVLDINSDLLALSKKTFLVDKALGQALGQVIGNLRSGIVNVEEARLPQGKTNFNTALKHMNQLARILLERTNMVMDQQQGNASGMEFYMQQLQQMAGQQQKLNSGMPQLGMDGSPTSSMMDQLSKMAARQQALRKRLKQIQQGMSEQSGGKPTAGNLDKIAKDMEDVINQMRKNRVDRQTIMRQEKIVQRLLDASRSATSRDYKKERESKTGKELLRENPLSLPGDLGDHESLIDIIRREVQNSDLTPAEKRDMEKYLESLLNKGLKPE